MRPSPKRDLIFYTFLLGVYTDRSEIGETRRAKELLPERENDRHNRFSPVRPQGVAHDGFDFALLPWAESTTHDDQVRVGVL
jgi:hypothetical protein